MVLKSENQTVLAPQGGTAVKLRARTGGLAPCSPDDLIPQRCWSPLKSRNEGCRSY